MAEILEDPAEALIVALETWPRLDRRQRAQVRRQVRRAYAQMTPAQQRAMITQVNDSKRQVRRTQTISVLAELLS